MLYYKSSLLPILNNRELSNDVGDGNENESGK